MANELLKRILGLLHRDTAARPYYTNAQIDEFRERLEQEYEWIRNPETLPTWIVPADATAEEYEEALRRLNEDGVLPWGTGPWVGDRAATQESDAIYQRFLPNRIGF